MDLSFAVFSCVKAYIMKAVVMLIDELSEIKQS